jgi:hypothetical protein
MNQTITFNEHIFADDFAEMYETLGYFLGQLSLTSTILGLDFKPEFVEGLPIADNVGSKRYLFVIDIKINANWINEEGVEPYIFISEDSKLTIQGKIKSI